MQFLTRSAISGFQSVCLDLYLPLALYETVKNFSSGTAFSFFKYNFFHLNYHDRYSYMPKNPMTQNMVYFIVKNM